MFDAARREEALHKVHHPRNGAADQPSLFFNELARDGMPAPLEPLGRTVDDGERRSELMGGHRYELALQLVDVTFLVE